MADPTPSAPSAPTIGANAPVPQGVVELSGPFSISLNGSTTIRSLVITRASDGATDTLTPSGASTDALAADLADLINACDFADALTADAIFSLVIVTSSSGLYSIATSLGSGDPYTYDPANEIGGGLTIYPTSTSPNRSATPSAPSAPGGSVVAPSPSAPSAPADGSSSLSPSSLPLAPVGNDSPQPGVELDVIIIAGQSNERGYADASSAPARYAAVDDSRVNVWDEEALEMQKFVFGSNHTFGTSPINSDQFGVESELAYLLATHSSRQTLLVRWAVNSTGLGASTDSTWSDTGANRLKLLRIIRDAKAALALKGYSLNFKLFYWGQGEKDANSANSNDPSTYYLDSLTSLVADVRLACGQPVKTLIRSTTATDAGYTQKTGVNTAKSSFVLADRNALLLDSSSISEANDDTHFDEDEDGIPELGRRVFYSLGIPPLRQVIRFDSTGLLVSNEHDWSKTTVVSIAFYLSLEAIPTVFEQYFGRQNLSSAVGWRVANDSSDRSKLAFVLSDGTTRQYVTDAGALAPGVHYFQIDHDGAGNVTIKRNGIALTVTASGKSFASLGSISTSSPFSIGGRIDDKGGLWNGRIWGLTINDRDYAANPEPSADTYSVDSPQKELLTL
ncbi:sialate O-acetylesterase [Roseibacillus persicicus]|uniref:sialate O-acetylesterase n=1 Tax=Roseibacillus persicicus TaxID=454148 RepID=UPI00398A5305